MLRVVYVEAVPRRYCRTHLYVVDGNDATYDCSLTYDALLTG